MIEVFSEDLFKRMESELSALGVKGLAPHEVLRDQLALIRSVMAELSAFVVANPFREVAHEVHYHKVIYPRFKSQLIFRVELYHLHVGVPLGGASEKVAFYRQHFRGCLDFVEQFRFYYTYRALGAVELDELYFTASGNRRSALLPVLAELDEGGTAVGYLYAKFRAFELLYERIASEITALFPPSGPDRGDGGSGGGGGPVFKWTGKTIDLIEIAHALHLSDEVENGNAGVVEFFKAFGDFFGVDLGIPKKGMDNLMDRKTIGRTRFLDNIRGFMHARMDELNAYDPDRLRRKMRL